MGTVNLTGAFKRIFDGIRPVSRVDPLTPVVFLDRGNAELGYEISSGYYINPISDGTGGNDKQLMLFITDREGIDAYIYNAERFLIGDTRYERVGNPSSPSTNPALWMILLKPVKRRTT